MSRRSFFSWLIVFTPLFFFSCPVYALGVRPAVNELTLRPGDVYHGFIFLHNDEDQPRHFFWSVQKFVPQGDRGQQTFLPPDDVEGLPQWIFFQHPFFDLAPQETKKIPFDIRTPSDASGGGNYAAIFFSTQPSLSAASFATSRVGSLLLVTVAGTTASQLNLDRFVIDGPTLQTRLPISFVVELKNVGNVHVTPQGDVTIENVFGEIVGRLSLNAEQGRVLPNSRRQFLIRWGKAASSGGSGFWHDAVEEWRNFAIGPYTATLYMGGAGAEKIVPQSVHIFIFPWHLLSLFIGCPVLLFFGWTRLRGRRTAS